MPSRLYRYRWILAALTLVLSLTWLLAPRDPLETRLRSVLSALLGSHPYTLAVDSGHVVVGLYTPDQARSEQTYKVLKLVLDQQASLEMVDLGAPPPSFPWLLPGAALLGLLLWSRRRYPVGQPQPWPFLEPVLPSLRMANGDLEVMSLSLVVSAELAGALTHGWTAGSHLPELKQRLREPLRALYGRIQHDVGLQVPPITLCCDPELGSGWAIRLGSRPIASGESASIASLIGELELQVRSHAHRLLGVQQTAERWWTIDPALRIAAASNPVELTLILRRLLQAEVNIANLVPILECLACCRAQAPLQDSLDWLADSIRGGIAVPECA